MSVSPTSHGGSPLRPWGAQFKTSDDSARERVDFIAREFGGKAREQAGRAIEMALQEGWRAAKRREKAEMIPSLSLTLPKRESLDEYKSAFQQRQVARQGPTGRQDRIPQLRRMH